MNTTTQSPSQLANYDVIDSSGNKIGSVDGIWVDQQTNNLKYIGVKTGLLGGKDHVIPVANANINNANQTIQVPYTDNQVKNAPGAAPSATLSQNEEQQISNYYQSLQTPSQSAQTSGPTTPGASPIAVEQRFATGSYPVSNLTYDLITSLYEKLKGMDALGEYLRDAQGNQDVVNTFERLREENARAVQEMLGYLARELNRQGITGS